MNPEISSRILGTKGLSDKEIKQYYKRLKDLRQVIAKNMSCGRINEYFYELDGGFRFFYQEWQPTQNKSSSPPRFIIFVFHDAYGCSDIFYPLADILTHYGALVVGIDYRGHGRTAGFAGGHLGDIENIKMIFTDIEHLLYQYKKKYDLPIYLLGYDIGALIALHIAHRNQDHKIEGLILISPLLKLKKQLKHIMLYPLISIGKVFTKNEPVQRVLKEEQYSTYYKEYVDFSNSDPFRLSKMSYRMFKKFLDLIYFTPRLIPKISFPCIIFQGTADNIVDHASIEKIFQKWPHPKKKIRMYQNGGHNLLMDRFTYEVYQEILNFIGLE
ncbi:MAG: alpha/beta hydrolase [Candidatus Lokiarchaeota archaeon]|nr:alpha/beta hydrolase [Candidatus Harpocratesius repetitus]